MLSSHSQTRVSHAVSVICGVSVGFSVMTTLWAAEASTQLANDVVTASTQTFTAAELAVWNPTSIAELSTLLAGISVQSGPSLDPQLAASGAAVNSLAANNNSVVAVLLNGVELPYAAYLRLPLLDMRSVEWTPGSDAMVGRGAVGGVLRLTPMSAEAYSASFVKVSGDNAHDARLEGMWQEPLSPHVSARAAIWVETQRSEQSVQSLNPLGIVGSQSLGSNTTLATRLSVNWQPAEYFRSWLVLDASNLGGPTQAYQSLGNRRASGQCVTELNGSCQQAVGPALYQTTAESITDGQGQFSLGDRNVEHAYGLLFKTQLSLPDVLLNTSTSWRYVNRYVGESQGSLTAFGDQYSNIESNTFAEDIQLESSGWQQPADALENNTHSGMTSLEQPALSTATWQWRVGAHYGHDRINDANQLDMDPNAAIVMLPSSSLTALMIQSTDTLAVYAQASKRLSSDAWLSVGVKDSHLHYTYNDTNTVNASQLSQTPLIYGGAVLAQDQSQNAPTLNLRLSQTTHWGQAYGLLQSGFSGSGLPGGVMVDQTAKPFFNGLFAQSTPKSYSATVGTVADSAGQGSFGLEAFVSSFNQVDGPVNSACPLELAGVGHCTYASIGNAETEGARVSWKSPKGWLMTSDLQGTVEHARYVNGLYSGLIPILTPTVSLVASTAAPLPMQLFGFTHTVYASLKYQSAMDMSVNNVAADAVAAREDLKLRWVLSEPDKPMSWSIFVDNAFNQAMILDQRGAGSLLLPDRRLLGLGRVVGLRLDVKTPSH